MGEETIDAISQSLSTLTANLAQNQKIMEKGSNTLVSWASSTGQAGKNWTTFSRLTSGTGIWKLQNYLRGALEVIGKFSDSTKNQIKEQTENEKKLAQTVKGVKKVNEEYSALQKTFKNQEKLTARLERTDKSEQKQLKKRQKLIDEAEKKDKKLIASKKALADSNKVLAEKQKEINAYLVQESKVGKLTLEDARHLKEMQDKLVLGKKALTKSQKEYDAALEKSTGQEIISKEAIKEKFAARRKQHEELAKLTDQQKEALESTNAYNQAIITGKSEVEAYAEGFKQLTENVDLNNKTFDEFKEKMTKAQKVKEAFDAGIQSPEFAELGKDVRSEQKETGKEGFKENNEEFGKVLKNVGKGLAAPIVGGFKFLKAPIENIKKLAPMLGQLKRIPALVKNSKLAMKIRMKGLAFQKFMKPVLNMAFKFLIFGILGMIALLAVAKIAYDIMGVMAEFGIFDDMKEIFLAGVTILTSVFGIIGSFMDGDFSAMFDYLGTIMSSLMTIGWNLLQIFVKGIFAIAVGIFYSIIDMMVWFFDGGWKTALPALLKIGVTLVALYFIKYLVSQALLLIGVYALPIMMFVLVAALIYAVFRMAYKKFEPVKKAVDFIGGLFSDLWGWITGIWASVKGSINDVLDWFGADTLATGGLTDGNTTLVGENGPERVRLPAGSRVYSNSQSRSMSNGSTVINNNITINAKDTSDQELRRIADKIGTMVNNKINRNVSSRTLG